MENFDFSLKVGKLVQCDGGLLKVLSFIVDAVARVIKPIVERKIKEKVLDYVNH